MVTSYQKLYYLQTSVTLLTSIPITGKVLLNHKNMEICCLQLTIRLSAMTFRGMVNDAMAPKLTTIEESMVCCPQELLVEGYDHVWCDCWQCSHKNANHLMHYASTKACRTWFTLLKPSCGRMKKLSLFNIQGYLLATNKRLHGRHVLLCWKTGISFIKNQDLDLECDDQAMSSPIYSFQYSIRLKFDIWFFCYQFSYNIA